MARKRACDTVAYWESRRYSDLYLFGAACPTGPTAKFRVNGITCSKSMKFIGNFCLRTRPILVMDQAFTGSYEMRICAELLKRMFQIGKNHPRNAPFIDHAYTF